MALMHTMTSDRVLFNLMSVFSIMNTNLMLICQKIVRGFLAGDLVVWSSFGDDREGMKTLVAWRLLSDKIEANYINAHSNHVHDTRVWALLKHNYVVLRLLTGQFSDMTMYQTHHSHKTQVSNLYSPNLWIRNGGDLFIQPSDAEVKFSLVCNK